MRIQVGNIATGYKDIVGTVLKQGTMSSPRDIPTTEILGASVVFNDAFPDMPTGVGRSCNAAIGIAEALQLFAGESHPDLMISKFPNFKNFTDGGAWFHGAYGPRIKHQLPKVIEALKSDNNTRQAIMTIWDPRYDGFGDVRDTPCTTGFQFLLRDDRLHMVTTMRSNDVWWGLAYDVFQFTFLQKQIADILGVEQGQYTHNVGSLHMYERDFEKYNGLLDSRSGAAKIFISRLSGGTLNEKRASAGRILTNDPQDLSSFEDELRRELHG